MTAQRPNIVLILTDQQRFDTIGAINNPVIRTPSLDRLTRAGTVFTSAYTPSPVCVSARCSLIYGQYPYRTGCYDNGYRMPEGGRETFFGALTAAGYRTHGIGKCHFTGDPFGLRGFGSREIQEELISDPEADDYLRFLRSHGGTHLTDPHGVRGEMYYVPQPAQMPAALHPTQWVGDRSVAFIEAQTDTPQPWFLYASFIHPHPPFAPPAPWHKLYRAPLMPLPHVPQDTEALWTSINRWQNRYKYRDQGSDQNLLRCIKAYYYACISFIDYQVGRILDALSAQGTLDHTLILFTSDHGELLGDYHCFGKRSMHDACARIPLIAHLPSRFAAGRQCDEPVSLVDIAPTVLAAAGASLATHQPDGCDLSAIAAGSNQRAAVFSQLQREGKAIYTVVTPRWKYAYSAPDQQEFLFDRRADPLETRNRAALPFCRQDLKDVRQILIEALRTAGETSGLDGENWKPFPRFTMPIDPDAGLLIQDHPWAKTSIPGYTS
ncbi:MAG: sulfatase-like hydrolase/transferase [Chloroflexi bacterium]|nr:sulfatase-like hydrolase/transferase [Chloroflexota bacterium]